MVDFLDNTKGKTRSLPVAKATLDRMAKAAEMIDPSLSIQIVSGGQEKLQRNPITGKPITGQKRTGSERHDVDETGHSHTADIVLVRNGKPLFPNGNKELYGKYMRNAAALGFEGIGHYKWGIHVGGGSRAAWGPSTSGSDLDPYFKAAIEEGWANPIRPDGSDTVSIAQATNAGADTSVTVEDVPYLIEDVIAARNGPDITKTNPLSGANIEFGRQNPNNLPDNSAPEPSLWELQKDAFNTEQTASWMFRQSDTSEPDPNFRLSVDRVNQDLGNIGADPAQYASWLVPAQSEDSYRFLLDGIRDDNDRQRRLSGAGLTGATLRIANNILDPVGLGSDFVVASFAPYILCARRAADLGRILTPVIGGAAGGAASESVGVAYNPHRDQMDILYGTVFGAGVGGVVGALSRNPHTATEAARLSEVAKKEVQDYDFSKAAGINMAGAGGAARAPQSRQFLNDEAFEFLEDRDIAKTAFGKLRLDLFAQMDKSPLVTTRAGAGLVQDGTGKVKGAINPIAASEERVRFREEWDSAFMRTYKPAFNEYLSRQDGGLLNRAYHEAQFNEKVYDYIIDRGLERGERYDPAVARAGDRMAKLQQEMGYMGQNPFHREGELGGSVAGFEDFRPNVHYVTRQFDNDKIVGATREYVDGTLVDLFKGAIRKAQYDMDEALLNRLSNAYVRAITDRAHGLDDAAVKSIGAENIETLVETLTQNGGLSREDATSLLARFAKTSDAGVDARAKHRMLLDEGFFIEAPLRKDGTRDIGERLYVSDLVNKDASQLFMLYSDRMAGMVALARYRFKDPANGEVLIDGFKRDADFDHYKQLVEREGADKIAAGKATREQVDKDIRNLEFAYSSIRGRPVSAAENTEFGWWSRMVRKFNFTRLMNQVGFAQVSELGSTIGSLGAKAAFSHMPALRRMLNQDGETVLRSGLAQDIENWFGGIGTERLRYRSNYQLDDITGTLEQNNGSWRNKANRFLTRAGRVTSEVSGMTQANIVLERQVATSIIQKFANMAAAGGKGMSKARLADLALDEDMTARVLKMFNVEGNMEYTRGIVSRRKVARMHLDKWEDKPAREAFIAAADRLSRQIIQKNDIGNMIPWMSHPAAKMLMQFRTFMVGAYTKQTLKAAHFRDGPALATAMFTMALASAVYVAQTKIQAIGRSDQDEWLENRLSWSSIGAAGFARTGMSSIIPMLMDTGLYATGQDPMFSHTRTTGQVSNMLFGNPTTGGLDDLMMAGRSLAGLFEDREWSQEEARALPRMMMFGNALPLVTILNTMIEDLPAFAPGGRF